MAHGAPDYWVTQQNWLSGLIWGIKVSVTSGGDLHTKLDNLDGKADGRLDLSTLTVAETGVLARLLNVVGALETGGDLLTKLDNLDGAADGKLDVSSLTDDATGLLAKLLNVVGALETGGDLLTKLDNLDGKADGKLDISALTDTETGILAKLLYVAGNLETGSDLITQLDALDGTVDGLLTLGELNSSDVKTNLDDTLTKLDSTISKLNDQLTKLTSVDSNTSDVIYSGYNKIDTSEDTIVDISDTAGLLYTFEAHTHPANTDSVTLRCYKDAVLKHTFTIASGGCAYHYQVGSGDMWNIIKVVAASAEQYYKLIDPFNIT